MKSRRRRRESKHFHQTVVCVFPRVSWAVHSLVKSQSRQKYLISCWMRRHNTPGLIHLVTLLKFPVTTPEGQTFRFPRDESQKFLDTLLMAFGPVMNWQHDFVVWSEFPQTYLGRGTRWWTKKFLVRPKAFLCVSMGFVHVLQFLPTVQKLHV